LFRYSDIRM